MTHLKIKTSRKHLHLFLIIISAALLFQACKKVTGEGPVVAESRTRNNFTAIAMRISGDLYVTQDSVYKVEIRAQQNILDVIETPVINNELVIRVKNTVNIRSNEDISIHVSAPVITSLALSGSGNLQTSGEFRPSNMRLTLSGSGNIMLPILVTNQLEAVISGSGNIHVAGTAGNESLKISGSGSMDLLNVATNTVSSSTSGSGNIRVNVSQSLSASISGSGNIYYKGNPIISSNISGSGKLIPL